ncbi:MAG TPA: glycosyltransferase family A protein [Candidatus Bathyarchaeia archaeon]|nr:glycosyltransferase family A protein [Candidatus Bathyarchaeia archaeon]
MKPEITVGVCVRNAQRTIAETIEGILEQDYSHDLLELIVVDGNSSDATLSIVRKLISKTNVRWRLYSDGGKGLGYARQTVVNHAHGRYVVFVDSDTIIRNDFLRRQIEFMNTNPRVGVGLGRYMYQEGNWISSTWNLYHYTMQDFVGCAFIFRRDAVRSVNGFDEQIKGAGEDVDLITRMQSKGWSSAMNERAEFFHNYRATMRDFWLEHSWFGYGGYYLALKNRNLFPPSRNLPHGKLVHGLRTASRAYRTTGCKISFLILPLLLFGNLAWWSGFLNALTHRYGRKGNTAHAQSRKSMPSKRESSSL